MRLKHTTLTTLAFLAALGALPGCDDDDDERDAGVDAGRVVVPDAGAGATIAALAAERPELSMLVAAATRANLGDELSAAGPLTLFAPTNQAFAASGITMDDIDAMSDEELTRVLTYHLIEGVELLADDITSGPVLTAADLTLFVNEVDGAVTLNGGNTVTGGANVTSADIDASNGVIHAIDRVLLPPDVPTLATYGGLTTLATAIGQAGLTDDLTESGQLTVFAPTNDAFAALPALPTGDALEAALLYHVLDRELTAGALAVLDPPQAAALVANRFGDPLVVVFDTADGARVNDAAVIEPDLRATNGIVHVIDRVLVAPNVLQMAELLGLTAFVGAVEGAAGVDGTSLADALLADQPLTVFAPTNEAFAAIEATLATLTPEQVRDVLLFHVLDPATFPTPVLAGELPAGTTPLDTLLGEDAVLVTTTTPPTIEGARIVRTDVTVLNGVIHVIDAVMIPPSFE